jgi:hypothetical protein
MKSTVRCSEKQEPFTKGAASKEPLMKQVIARSPAELKPVLLQAANINADWSNFIRYGENSGWVAFLDKIVNNIYHEQRKEIPKRRYKEKIKQNKMTVRRSTVGLTANQITRHKIVVW